MRYGQITTRRLSHAAAKLDPDGAWHPADERGSLRWYRVWQRTIVQRATFENEQEQEALLPLIEALPPLELAKSEGFREELTIEMGEDGFELVVLLGTAPADLGLLPRRNTVRYENRDGALMACASLVDGLTAKAITAAQTEMMQLRAEIRALIL